MYCYELKLIVNFLYNAGPGEQGQPLHLKPEDEHEKQELYKVNGFNALASDRIALNRSLPDIRHPGYVYSIQHCQIILLLIII